MLRSQHSDNRNDSLEDFVVWNQLKDVISLEEENKTWNCLLTGLPSSQLCFISKAGMDCLPTPPNLMQWKYCSRPSCSLCGSNQATCTSLHIINGCPEVLNRGRFTWRYDSVLNSLLLVVKHEVSPSAVVYGDLPGHCASNNPQSTLPLDLSVSLAHLDLVVREDREIHITELTVCLNTQHGFVEARARKTHKSTNNQLVSDLVSKGLKVIYTTLDIGSLEHCQSQIKDTIIQLIPGISQARMKQVLTTLGKITIGCTYSIFNARNSVAWQDKNPFILCLYEILVLYITLILLALPRPMLTVILRPRLTTYLIGVGTRGALGARAPPLSTHLPRRP